MPSQGVFSNEGVLSGDIKVLYQTINGKQHVKALNISKVDKDGDDISLSLAELDAISLPLSSSGELTNLQVLSITEKTDYYFIDVEDVVLNDILSTQSDKVVGVSPYLAESFFYNNYNAIISNAETAKTSFLRYDVDRTGGQVKPSNFEAIAGFGKVTFSEMTPGVGDYINYTTGSYFGEKLSPVKTLDNDRDMDVLVLEPELIDNLGIPQISVNTVPSLAFSRNPDYFMEISASLILEVDDNENFNNANNHYYSASIADQLYAENALNYTFTPFKHTIESGSFTSGKVCMRLKQRNLIVDLSDTVEFITSTPFLSSNPATVDYLNVDLYYNSDQEPYAPFAPVQDSNYTTTGIINARYNGTKTGEDDFSGISPAVAAKPLEASIYRVDEDDQFICSQSLSDRKITEILFEGPTEFPTASLDIIGYINYPVSSSNQETVMIQGIPQRQPQSGDIISIQSEEMLVLQVTRVVLPTKYPYYDLLVKRGYNSTTATTHPASYSVRRYSGARLLSIDRSRLIALSSKKIWIKENRNILITNDRGFVTQVSEVCTV